MRPCHYIDNLAVKRTELLQSSTAKPIIDEIINSANIAISQDSPAFKMSEYMMYFENGNRSVFEKSYFTRRRHCSNIMMAYWLTEDEKYLLPLIDYISYICDEFTWCLPAHSEFPCRLSKGTIEHVDLFQAETARLLAETVMCVGDKLPEYMLDRMNYEIHRRIFSVFEQGEFCSRIHPTIEIGDKYSWETCKMNWATVCGAGCTMAALYFGTNAEMEKYVTRFIGCLESYLEGIADDGCCQEGMAYWSYGFGHFVILAQIVKSYTHGQVDFFKNPKVKELALFPQKIRMSTSKVASFSDGGENFTFKIGLLSFLKSIYDEVCLPDLKRGTRHGNVNSICELLWFDTNYQSQEESTNTYYLSNSQWYINHKPKYCFAAKGGHNDEPHNHNDIGSFMITVGDETLISDLGCGEYVKETFMEETRYNYVQNSSRGHSVPIINGEYQLAGAKYKSKNATATESSFSLDIEGAYNSRIINKIHRIFTIHENSVVLKDTFVFSSETKSITERIITKIKPHLGDGVVDLEHGKIKFDPDKYSADVKSENFVSHDTENIITAYQIDFSAKSSDETEFCLEFVF